MSRVAFDDALAPIEHFVFGRQTTGSARSAVARVLLRDGAIGAPAGRI